MTSIHGDKVTFAHEFGGCSFNDPESSDWPGALAVSIDGMPGWRATADLTVVRTPRGTGDGDYFGDRFPKKSRMITIQGYLLAPDRETLDQMFDLIVTNAFPVDTDIVMTRHEPTPKYVTCRLAGSVEDTEYLIDPRGADALRWEATVLCDDPLKYDAMTTLSGAAGVSGLPSGGRTYPRVYPLVYNVTASGEGEKVTLYNAGTTDAPALISVHGPIPIGWRLELSNTGERLSFAVALNASDVLVVDTGDKSALLNGFPVNGTLSGTWWRLKPRGNTVRLYGNYDSAAGFSVLARSSWR